MNALFAWPGGKKGLIKTLRNRIPAHKIYVEVFAGSAKLLFAKEPSPAEVVNDINGDVTNFFRVAKHRAAELAEVLEQDVIHPERFRDLAIDTSADELARALRFAYRTWYSYGAKGEHFAGVTLKELLEGDGVRRPLDSVRALLTAATERLRRVRIEQRDCLELIARFDSQETFFYLDPPYVHFQPIARYEALAADKREDLFVRLAAIKGSFLMSFDDCDEVRDLANRHRMQVEEVMTAYTLAHTAGSRGGVREVLISR